MGGGIMKSIIFNYEFFSEGTEMSKSHNVLQTVKELLI